jgi:hypothetical protein
MTERLVAADGDRLAVSGDTEADGTFPVLNGGRGDDAQLAAHVDAAVGALIDVMHR